MIAEKNVVPVECSHIPPLGKEMGSMTQQIIVKCVGELKEPSKEALDQFITLYLQMVEENRMKGSAD